MHSIVDPFLGSMILSSFRNLMSVNGGIELTGNLAHFIVCIPRFPWNKLKPLVISKLENVIQDYVESNPDETMEVLPNVENIEFKDMRERLLQAINAFTK